MVIKLILVRLSLLLLLYGLYTGFITPPSPFNIGTYPHKHRVEFIEMLYTINEQIPVEESCGTTLDHMGVRSRPNLTRIMAEHVNYPKGLDEWEFVLNLPDLYGGTHLRVLERMMIRGDKRVMRMLHRYGHLKGYEEAIEEIGAKIKADRANTEASAKAVAERDSRTNFERLRNTCLL